MPGFKNEKKETNKQTIRRRKKTVKDISEMVQSKKYKTEMNGLR